MQTQALKSIPIKFEKFQAVDDADCQRRIIAAREKLGKRLVILGHHYQHESVYRHADFTGDSLKLSKYCEDLDAEFMYVTGVIFSSNSNTLLCSR